MTINGDHACLIILPKLHLIFQIYTAVGFYSNLDIRRERSGASIIHLLAKTWSIEHVGDLRKEKLADSDQRDASIIVRKPKTPVNYHQYRDKYIKMKNKLSLRI